MSATAQFSNDPLTNSRLRLPHNNSHRLGCRVSIADDCLSHIVWHIARQLWLVIHRLQAPFALYLCGFCGYGKNLSQVLREAHF